MTKTFERATLLFQQSRYDDAIKAFHEILQQDPEDPYALMYIGWCYLIQEKYAKSLEYTEMAYRIAPDEELIAGNFAQALFRNNRRSEALNVLDEAIKRYPTSYILLFFKAQIHYFNNNYEQAENAIKLAAELEPESTDVLNLYHQILIKQQKQDEAAEVMDYVLKEAPEDSYAHANMGWKHIRTQNTKEAKASFMEALRLDPSNTYAKEGLKETIRVENPFYRAVHKFFVWMDQFSAGRQTAIIIGLYVAYRAIIALSESNPALNIILFPLIILYIIFALSTWVAKPFSNFFLQFNKIGKHILSRDERIGANLIGGSFMIAILSLIGMLITNSGLFLLVYLVTLIASITFSGAFLFNPKSSYRKLLVLLSIAFVGAALYGFLGGEGSESILNFIGIGVLLYTFLVPMLARREATMFYGKE